MSPTHARAGAIMPRYVAPAGGSYSSAVTADAPVAWWRLGDASGTTMTDSSGNAHHGTYIGSPTLGTTGLITGDTDTAVTFSSGKYGQVSFAAWMWHAAFTVEAVIKPSSLPASGEIFGWQDTGIPYLLFRLESSKLVFYVRSSSSTWQSISSATGAISAGTKYHVAATYASGVPVLYLNGSQVATTSGWTLISSASMNCSLGIGANSNNVSSETFTGVIDEAAFYGAALTSTRIAAHAALI